MTKHRLHVLDGALLSFDRTSGTNVLVATEATRHLVRRAPRTLQIGLLTPCNLRCSFCYRDAEAPSRLTYEDVLAIARDAARWGVLEVAFGGGEPFLFRRFPELVEEIHATTPLGVNVTTNGMFLTRELAERLRPALSEIRLSIYEDNDWRERLGLLRGHSVGANWLVTPDNVNLVVPRVLELLKRGARNVLLLGYKGEDDAFRLSERDFESLRRAIGMLEGLPVRVDVCWYPHLRDLPYLFERTDCGAGDESLMITPDKQVQACSFAKHRVPFETFDDLRRIWSSMRAERPHAQTGGCTRELFQEPRDARVVSGRVLPHARDAAYAWQAWASSNSGPYLLIARFPTEESAEKVADELTAMYEEHLRFANGPGYRDWDYYEPSPPLQDFARAHGFEWPAQDGFAWESMEEGGLHIRQAGTNVVVHVRYGQQIGERGIAIYAAQEGADLVIHTEQPFVIRASAPSAAARKAIDTVVSKAVDELEDMTVEGDEDGFDGNSYIFEVETSRGPLRVGFGSHIGGQIDAARFLLMLSEADGASVRVEKA
jgi:MoaA/NifB/PqqE/SkfB family radical SAM enzyme